MDGNRPKWKTKVQYIKFWALKLVMAQLIGAKNQITLISTVLFYRVQYGRIRTWKDVNTNHICLIFFLQHHFFTVNIVYCVYPPPQIESLLCHRLLYFLNKILILTSRINFLFYYNNIHKALGKSWVAAWNPSHRRPVFGYLFL